MSSEDFCTLPDPDPFLSPSRSEAGAENGTARHRQAEWRGPTVRRCNPKNVDDVGQALPARDSCNCFLMASRIEPATGFSGIQINATSFSERELVTQLQLGFGMEFST